MGWLTASAIYKSASHTVPIKKSSSFPTFMVHVMGLRAWRGGQTGAAKVGVTPPPTPLLPNPGPMELKGGWARLQGWGWETDIQHGLSPTE